MKKLTNKKRFSLGSSKGFTLIEVVLVLAIGGLIFLLAFIAFQQVSANRRDTQRRSDAGRLVAELQNYFGDKRSYPSIDSTGDICTPDTGAPNGFRTFAKNYMCTGPTKSEFKSPSGTNYRSRFIFDTSPKAVDDIIILPGFTCDFTPDPNSNAILMSLEKGEVCRSLKG